MGVPGSPAALGGTVSDVGDAVLGAAAIERVDQRRRRRDAGDERVAQMLRGTRSPRSRLSNCGIGHALVGASTAL